MFAPAMNAVMYRNRAVRRNMALLREDGHLLVPARETPAVANGDQAGGMSPLPNAVTPYRRQVLLDRA